MDSNKKLKQLLIDRDIRFIDQDTATKLKEMVDPISKSYFRRLLRNSGIPIAHLVEGVRQKTLEHLERSLLALVTVDHTSALPLVVEVRKHTLLA